MAAVSSTEINNAESSLIIDEEAPIPNYRTILSIMLLIMVETFFPFHGLEIPSSDTLVEIRDEALSIIDEDEYDYYLGNEYSRGRLYDMLLQVLLRRYHTDMVMVMANATAAAFDVGASEFKTVPADDKVLASLKRVKVGELRNFKVDNDQACSVCLDELDKDEVVCLLPCDHFFHDNCIGEWLNKNHVCPLCRFELPATITS